MEAQWGSNFAYVTQDGSFAIFGDAVNLDTQEQITEGVRRADRLSLLSGLGDDKVVTFSPAKPQYTVTVFTDVDCGYCRMLHRQMAEYNTKGIAVRYLFYPRSGPGTDSYRKAEAVMCAKDLKAAMDEAKNTGDYKGPSNCGNKLVDAQYEIGTQFGLRGTPMIVLPDGETIPGYVPPDQLAARLVAIDLQKSAATKVN